MPVALEVPDNAWSEITVPLSGEIFNITYYFNDTDQRWRFDLKQEDTVLIAGVSIMENAFFLSQYNLDKFTGDIACVRRRGTTENVSRDNLGVGKDYELVYFTAEEIAAL